MSSAAPPPPTTNPGWPTDSMPRVGGGRSDQFPSTPLLTAYLTTLCSLWEWKVGNPCMRSASPPDPMRRGRASKSQPAHNKFHLGLLSPISLAKEKAFLGYCIFLVGEQMRSGPQPDFICSPTLSLPKFCHVGKSHYFARVKLPNHFNLDCGSIKSMCSLPTERWACCYYVYIGVCSIPQSSQSGLSTLPMMNL